jgi:hypothetical protein
MEGSCYCCGRPGHRSPTCREKDEPKPERYSSKVQKAEQKKEKTTCSKSVPAVSDFIEIPPELLEAQRDVALCIGKVFVNGLPFLATVSRRLLYRTAEWIPDGTPASFMKGLEHVFKVYKNAGFKITSVHADPEFKPLLAKVETSFQAKGTYCKTEDHVPEAQQSHYSRAYPSDVPTNSISDTSKDCNNDVGYGKYKMSELLSSRRRRVYTLQSPCDYYSSKLGLQETLFYSIWRFRSSSCRQYPKFQ